MADKIDELFIQITADTKKLRADLDNVKGQLKTTGRRGQKAFVPMGNSIRNTAIAAVALSAALKAMQIGRDIADAGSMFEDLRDSLDGVFGSAKEGQKALDQILEFSQKTPFQVETVTRAFIALRSAGIEPNTRMLQAFADAASVSTDQVGTFNALIRVMQRSPGGVQLEELNMIADRGIDVFGGLQEKLGKTRLELSDFGKTAEGAKLITDALIDVLEEDFGGQMAQKMDNLSTKVSNMQIAFMQLNNEIFLSGFGEMLKDMADSMTRFADSVAKIIRLGGGRGRLQDFGISLIASPEDQLAEMVELVEAQSAAVDIAKSNLKGARPEEEGQARSLLSAEQTTLDNMLNLVLDLQMEIDGVSVSVNHLGETVIHSEMVDFFETFNKLAEDSKDPLKEIDLIMARINEIAKSNELMKYFGATDETIERIRKHLQGMKGELSNTKDGMLIMAEVIMQTSHAFTADFVNALMEGESALDSFKNFAKDLVGQIITTFLKLTVVNRILNAIFGESGMGVSNWVDLPTFASGGTVQQNKAIIVGEQGPEMFIPNTGGTILNAMNTRSAMGGGGGDIVINQNLNFATGVQSTVRSEVIKLLPTISEVTKASVMDSASRGGNFARAIRG